MQASFFDLRKRIREILRALDRNEEITILYRGKPKAILRPISRGEGSAPLEEQPAFGMWADREDMKDVQAYMNELRKPRHEL